jgi:cytochrome c
LKAAVVRISVLAAAAVLATAAATALASPPGDPVRGEKVYQRCIGCHSLDRDRTGPHHAGVFGRRVGGVDGFQYSPALKKAGAAGMVWNEKTLDAFLANPRKFLPGTRMGYGGVKDDQERADLIAYLRAQSEGAKAEAPPR